MSIFNHLTLRGSILIMIFRMLRLNAKKKSQGKLTPEVLNYFIYTKFPPPYFQPILQTNFLFNININCNFYFTNLIAIVKTNKSKKIRSVTEYFNEILAKRPNINFAYFHFSITNLPPISLKPIKVSS